MPTNQKIAAAVDVEVHIDDWAAMADVFGDLTSDKQAEFLAGFYEHVGDMQLAYIGAEEIFARCGRSDVAQFFRDLADHIENPS